MREFIGTVLAFLLFCAWVLLFVSFNVAWYRHNVEGMVGFGFANTFLLLGSIGIKR